MGQSAEDYTRRLRNTPKKVVHFQHFLAETPSQGCIFYEKLVWPPEILTTWSIFLRFPKNVKNHAKLTQNKSICKNPKTLRYN